MEMDKVGIQFKDGTTYIFNVEQLENVLVEMVQEFDEQIDMGMAYAIPRRTTTRITISLLIDRWTVHVEDGVLGIAAKSGEIWPHIIEGGNNDSSDR